MVVCFEVRVSESAWGSARLKESEEGGRRGSEGVRHPLFISAAFSFPHLEPHPDVEPEFLIRHLFKCRVEMIQDKRWLRETIQ